TVLGGEDFVDTRVAGLRGSPARKRTLAAAWAVHLGLHPEAIKRAQACLAAHPGSVVATDLLARIHWDHQERGQAADLLGRLDRSVGSELPYIRGQQARFWLQQDRNDQARDHFVALRDAYPNRPRVWMRLADYFRDEGWHQERCDALERAHGLRPRWPYVMKELAGCYKAVGRGRASVAMFREGLAERPGDYEFMQGLKDAHTRARQLERAIAYAKRIAVGWPANYGTQIYLGDLYRKHGDLEAAKEAYQAATAVDPDAGWGHKRLGTLARRRGDIAAAVAHWRDALARNPDDDKLSRYVSFHEAGPEEPWLVDVPDQDTIDAAIAGGRDGAQWDGADAVALIDHRVTRLFKDGSRSGVVTQVLLAINEQGRDRITSLRLNEPGRTQILHAYASNPDGTRVEATRPRDGKVRFRALEDGSVVVLQYRYDGGPQPYLALHLAESWSFHSVAWASRWSQWSLWLDTDEVVHEQGVGQYTRTEEERGTLKRVTWAMKDVPALIPEPGGPPRVELLNHVAVSTVPDWGTFMRWEAALLAGAFRPDPELEAVAAALVSPEDSPADRVLALHRYVMNEIRYEQDYENTIAGVKPHVAPVVLERRYGDCKD
ncbi:MAG: tetratricopeptide repeat protein, partial [Myxococcota bacterium]|nr:tetratricopeptide repeat protein [Myxococcota bacterium]